MREDARHEPFPELLHAHIPERNLSSDSNHRGMTRTSGIRGPQFRGKSLMCGRPLPAIWMRGNGPGSGWRNGRTARRLLRVIAVVGLVLVLLIQLPPPTPGPSSSSPPPSMPFTTFRTDASVAEIQTTGAEPVESYAAFAVARGSAGAMALLRSQGHYAEPMVGSSTLQLLGGPIDLAASTMPPMAPWSAVSSEPAVGIVHFHGPIKIEWTQSLESLGLTILRYLPQDAFVVRGPSSTFAQVAALPAVDWTGPYAPQWKTRPDLPRDGVLDVRVVVFPGESPEAIEAWIGHKGIPPGFAAGSGPAVLGAFGSGDFRWARARIPANLVAALTALPSVEFVDPVRDVHDWNAETDWVIQSNATANYRYWNVGLDATGQVVGQADTGLDYDGDQFRQSAGTIVSGDLYNTTDLTRRKVVRYLNMGVLTGQLTWPGGGGPWDPWSIEDSNHRPRFPDCTFGHGTAVASTLAGNDTGIGASPNDGNAEAAKLYFQDIGTVAPGCPGGSGNADVLSYLPQDYADLFGPPGLVYNDPVAPVRIHSDSWGGTDNVYDTQARMVDAFVWAHPDMTILFAAGNCLSACSSGTIGTPATAKDIVTVGGAYNPDTGSGLAQNDLASQSGRGPTVDGRIKPTIVTIFDGESAMSDGNMLSGRGQPDDKWFGTSYSTPAAAAAAAIIRQYFTDGWYPSGRPLAADAMTPSAALIRALLIASGVPVTGSGIVSRSPSDTWPNNEQGFGRVLLSNVLPLASLGDTFRTQVVDGTAGLLTGDAESYTFHVTSPGPLKIVLAWSDFPGTLGSTKALVNDLDLEVTAPDGTVYRGNHFAPFAQAESLP
ncbi:MAG: hypothetical protein E6J94_01910, partial [Methanobacteriota archaeon]